MVEVSFSLETFEYFLLILVRISSFVFVAPFFSMTKYTGKGKDWFFCSCGDPIIWGTAERSGRVC